MLRLSPTGGAAWNRQYITQVLNDTADLCLIPGSKWARIADLPEDWPSYVHQDIVDAEGAPSEAVVAMRMKAAGAELVRTRDKALAQAADDVRTCLLDAHSAPNTVPGTNGGLPTGIDAEVARLGQLATLVD